MVYQICFVDLERYIVILLCFTYIQTTFLYIFFFHIIHLFIYLNFLHQYMYTSSYYLIHTTYTLTYSLSPYLLFTSSAFSSTLPRSVGLSLASLPFQFLQVTVQSMVVIFYYSHFNGSILIPLCVIYIIIHSFILFSNTTCKLVDLVWQVQSASSFLLNICFILSLPTVPIMSFRLLVGKVFNVLGIYMPWFS